MFCSGHLKLRIREKELTLADEVSVRVEEFAGQA